VLRHPAPAAATVPCETQLRTNSSQFSTCYLSACTTCPACTSPAFRPGVILLLRTLAALQDSVHSPAVSVAWSSRVPPLHSLCTVRPLFGHCKQCCGGTLSLWDVRVVLQGTDLRVEGCSMCWSAPRMLLFSDFTVAWCSEVCVVFVCSYQAQAASTCREGGCASGVS
jgi:hypothetical protein